MGKAKSLKSRVNSYFAKTIDHPKTRALVQRIDNIETIITRLRPKRCCWANLIKLHRPPLQCVLLRDDKSYLYVFISADKPYPSCLLMGAAKGNTAKADFWPFPSAIRRQTNLINDAKCLWCANVQNNAFLPASTPLSSTKSNAVKRRVSGWYREEWAPMTSTTPSRFLTSYARICKSNWWVKWSKRLKIELWAKPPCIATNSRCYAKYANKQAVYTVSEADIIAIASQAGITLCACSRMCVMGRFLGWQQLFFLMWIVRKRHRRITYLSLSAHFIFKSVMICLKSWIINTPPFAWPNRDDRSLNWNLWQKVTIKPKFVSSGANGSPLPKMNANNAPQNQIGRLFESNLAFNALNAVLKEALQGKSLDRIECFDISHTMVKPTIASCVVADQGGYANATIANMPFMASPGGDDYAAKQVLNRRYKWNSRCQIYCRLMVRAA